MPLIVPNEERTLSLDATKGLQFLFLEKINESLPLFGTGAQKDYKDLIMQDQATFYHLKNFTSGRAGSSTVNS